jgi:hypothetical protein
MQATRRWRVDHSLVSKLTARLYHGEARRSGGMAVQTDAPHLSFILVLSFRRSTAARYQHTGTCVLSSSSLGLHRA